MRKDPAKAGAAILKGCVKNNANAYYQLSNLTIRTRAGSVTGASYLVPLSASVSANVFLYNIRFELTADQTVDRVMPIICDNATIHLTGDDGGNGLVFAKMSGWDKAVSHLILCSGGKVSQRTSVAVEGGPIPVSTGTIVVRDGGTYVGLKQSGHTSAPVWTGTITGRRYNVTSGGLVKCFQGAEYFPGTVAGIPAPTTSEGNVGTYM